MSIDKIPENSSNTQQQINTSNPEKPQAGNAQPAAGNSEWVGHFKPLISRQIKENWLWILAYSLNLIFFVWAFIYQNWLPGEIRDQSDKSLIIPMFPGITLLCIIFIHVYVDPIHPMPSEGLDSEGKRRFEEKRAQQRQKWMIFAYSFMLLSIMLTFYPFIKEFDEEETEDLRAQPIAVFRGCSLESTDKNLSCFKLKTAGHEQKQDNPSAGSALPEKTAQRIIDEPVLGAWVMNIGGFVRECKKDSEGEQTVCQVQDGLLVPLYFIILALMGGCISLTRRLPELQKQVSSEHIASERQPKLTQYEFREYLIFQIVQFISAPFLAILAYYLVDPSNTSSSVALAFTAGFASETILLMIRSLANKITPDASSAPKYGAVVGVVTLSSKDSAAGTPAEKVEVSLSDFPQIQSITDDKGFFLLGNVPVGENSISIKSIAKGDLLKKDTVKIERAQAIVKKNITIVVEETQQ